MRKTLQYITNIQNLINHVLETQMDIIDEAGAIVAESIMSNGFVYAFGTGHSHMMAEELFYRAGGLARVYPILEDELILERYECNDKDCLIIASNSGRNPVSIEMVKAAHKRGMKVIGLTNLTHSEAQESRHVSGSKLYEIGDVVLDNQGCLGDASIYIPEIDRNIAATSTSLGAMLLQAVAISAIEITIEKGHTPEVFSSANLDEGDEINDRILAKYRSLIKPL